MELPKSEEFLAQCDLYKEQGYIYDPVENNKTLEQIKQELKLVEMEQDMDVKKITLKINTEVYNTNVLYKRKICFSMDDLSKHKECHKQISDIVSKIAHEKGYKAHFYEIEDRCRYDYIYHPMCVFVPISEYDENNYDKIVKLI